MSISATLRKAAQLQEKIEDMRGRLAALLAQARTEVEHTPTPDVESVLRRKTKGRRAAATAKAGARNGAGSRRHAALRGAATKNGSRNGHGGASAKRRVSPLKGKKRNASPSGPLAPAVVKVLSANGRPLSVREILDGLITDSYKFTSSEPKKNLAARIYRLKGVKQVGEGLFAAL